MPSLFALDESPAELPAASSKPHAPTSPLVSTGGLFTVTVTGWTVVELPAASRAIAVSVCWPFGTVALLQLRVKGALVSSAPRSAPSRRNCTPATPTLSVALAFTSIVPVTVEPPAGAVSETLGALVSAVTVARASFDAAPMFPAASSAVTR